MVDYDCIPLSYPRLKNKDVGKSTILEGNTGGVLKNMKKEIDRNQLL